MVIKFIKISAQKKYLKIVNLRQEGDRVRISKYREIFIRGYDPTHTEEIFVVFEILIQNYPTIYANLKGEKIKREYI